MYSIGNFLEMYQAFYWEKSTELVIVGQISIVHYNILPIYDIEN